MQDQFVSLGYRKWHINELEMLEELLPPEQAWLVVMSVSKYSAYGTEPDVPQELYYLVKSLCLGVDNSRKKYQKRCETNKANAKKGAESRTKQKESTSKQETSSTWGSGTYDPEAAKREIVYLEFDND